MLCMSVCVLLELVLLHATLLLFFFLILLLAKQPLLVLALLTVAFLALALFNRFDLILLASNS